MDKTTGLLDKIYTHAIYTVFRLMTAERGGMVFAYLL